MGLVDYPASDEEEEDQAGDGTNVSGHGEKKVADENTVQSDVSRKRKRIAADPIALPITTTAATAPLPALAQEQKTGAGKSRLTSLLPAPTSSVTKVDPIAFRQHDELRPQAAPPAAAVANGDDEEGDTEGLTSQPDSITTTKIAKKIETKTTNLFGLEVSDIPRTAAAALVYSSRGVATKPRHEKAKQPKKARSAVEEENAAETPATFGPLPGFDDDGDDEDDAVEGSISYTNGAEGVASAPSAEDGILAISQTALLDMDEATRAEWLPQLPNGGDLSKANPNKYSGVHKKKHNIMWLAQQAQEKRGELDAKYARIRQSRAEAASRYGFR